MRKTVERINMKFNIPQLDRIIIALLSNAHNKKFASNVKALFEISSLDEHRADYSKEVRVYLIKKLVASIIGAGLSDRDSVLASLDIEGVYREDAIEVLNELAEIELPENEVAAIDKLISDTLKFGAVERKAAQVISLLTEFEADTYEDFDSHMANISESLNDITKDIRDARESVVSSKNDVSFSDAGVVNLLGNMIDEAKNPSSKIRIGLRGVNDLVNGGLERGRVYCVFAVAKSWKSGFLLTSAIQAKKYNSFRGVVKPGMKPVILYLTMENSVKETVERIWTYSFGDKVDMSKFDKVAAASELEKAGVFTPNNPDSPELLIWYRPNKSISTLDLMGMLDDLEKDGKQCVLLVLDYLKRIRPSRPNKELRLELGQIADELTTIAKEKEIPILTAQQLNREAYRSANDDSMTLNEKMFSIHSMGANNIGESIDIIQNVDYGIILNKVQDVTLDAEGNVEHTDRWLCFKLAAARGKDPGNVPRVFAYKFRDENGMRLDEDIVGVNKKLIPIEGTPFRSATADRPMSSGFGPIKRTVT